MHVGFVFDVAREAALFGLVAGFAALKAKGFGTGAVLREMPWLAALVAGRVLMGFERSPLVLFP